MLVSPTQEFRFRKSEPRLSASRVVFALAASDRPIIITIDGPAGTGKSTVARQLAGRLGLDFLDTGAMYRAAAAIALDRGLDLSDPAALIAAVQDADLRFDWSQDPPSLLAWNRPIDQRLRDADVTSVVSPIAGIAALRRLMVEKQRQIGAEHRRLVSEGRDQGSVVFPDASVKFYLDASPEVRAFRRAQQLRRSGMEYDAEQVLEEIVARDRSDSTRPDGPLVCPSDALRVDTSSIPFEGVVDELERLVRARVNVD
ncbi:MAG: Cytidylate kinase [Phycisphaerales bacterium]|nr:Cytidylate kinase [Phycisphaerales bacterium]